MLSGQLSGTRAALSQMAVMAGAAPDENVPILPWDGAEDSLWVNDDYDEDEIPTGISHAGGELTDQARAWFERAMRKYVPVPPHYPLTYPPTLNRKQYPSNILLHRRARLKALHRHWDAQMPNLVDAYLLRQHGPVSQHTATPEDGEAAREHREGSDQPMEDVQATGGSDVLGDGSYFEVTAITTFGGLSSYTRWCTH